MRRVITIWMAVLFGTSAVNAGTLATYDYPQAVSTGITGSYGSNLIGDYTDASGNFPNNYHGFTYDGTTWSALNAPGAIGTIIYGNNGGNIVGSYYDASGQHGFLYNNGVWVPLDAQGANAGTIATGMSGGNIVGFCSDYNPISCEDATYGFLYDGTTWTTFSAPSMLLGPSQTRIYGIDGSNVVGSSWSDGVLYNLTSGVWTILDMPMAVSTVIHGISGSNLVGTYVDSSSNEHGFLYNGTNWTSLDMPGASQTYINGINGDNIFGSYEDASGNTHGFVYEIPEPATLLLLGLGGLFLRKRSR